MLFERKLNGAAMRVLRFGSPGACAGLYRAVFGALLILSIAGCNNSRSHTSQSQDAATGGSIPGYSGKMPSDDGQWLWAAKDYASTRYSSLDQINTNNAKDLKLAW